MENLVNQEFWSGKRVLITGHTGFKGSWLGLWLSQYSADLMGISLPVSKKNYLFNRIKTDHFKHKQTFSDIRDYSCVQKVIADFSPEIIFHMAAQPIVRHSYSDPLETFTTNILGTLNILEAVRTENVTQSYRNSFSENGSLFAMASARAGNVVGGGDMADDRLVPDFLKAFSSNKSIVLRNPKAIRPWQFVLDPIAGYLQLAEALHSDPLKFSSTWNFGPSEKAESVGFVVQTLSELSGAKPYKVEQNIQPHEEKTLLLDSSKSNTLLKWRCRLDLRTCLRWTLDWHNEASKETDMTKFSISQIERYLEIG